MKEIFGNFKNLNEVIMSNLVITNTAINSDCLLIKNKLKTERVQLK